MIDNIETIHKMETINKMKTINKMETIDKLENVNKKETIDKMETITTRFPHLGELIFAFGCVVTSKQCIWMIKVLPNVKM